MGKSSDLGNRCFVLVSSKSKCKMIYFPRRTCAEIKYLITSDHLWTHCSSQRMINSSEHLRDIVPILSPRSSDASRKEITEQISHETMGSDVIWEDGHWKKWTVVLYVTMSKCKDVQMKKKMERKQECTQASEYHKLTFGTFEQSH